MYQTWVEQYLIELGQDIMENDTILKLVDVLKMATGLFLLSHFFACIWMLIGQHRYYNYDSGWIKV